MQSCFEAPTEGVILLTYGAGNFPSNRPELIEIMKDANNRGVIIVNCSQCLKGFVRPIYETNKVSKKYCEYNLVECSSDSSIMFCV